MDINAAVGGERGLSRAKIDAALGVKSAADAGLSPREAVALEYADRVSATPVDVPDAFFQRLGESFSEREIVELTATIAHENYNSKFNRPLRVESNNFCELPLPTPEDLARAKAG
jgi:alkylhydroperoxidase family enzyme